MSKSTKVLALLLCLIAVSPMATASAQSKAKSSMSPANTVGEQMSRAFTNGYNVPSTGVAMEGYCPVCYLSANKAVKGKAEISHDYQGVTYWFVSDDARKIFVANPDKFLPAYGGWCALGVSMGQRFPVDPTNFKIQDGRIMLFLKNKKVDGLEIWNKDEASMLEKADSNWQKLKG